jgi:hypothetical protein
VVLSGLIATKPLRFHVGFRGVGLLGLGRGFWFGMWWGTLCVWGAVSAASNRITAPAAPTHAAGEPQQHCSGLLCRSGSMRCPLWNFRAEGRECLADFPAVRVARRSSTSSRRRRRQTTS